MSGGKDALRTIGAVETACTVLDVLEDRPEVGVSELADELDVTKGTAHCYLVSLEKQGFVVAEDGRYSLSLGYLGPGEAVRNRIEAINVIEGDSRRSTASARSSPRGRAAKRCASTENTVETRDELFEQLERIRDRGYAVDDEERVRGVRCVAGPVLRDGGEAVGAMSVSGPKHRMTDERLEESILDGLRRSVNVVEVNRLS